MGSPPKAECEPVCKKQSGSNLVPNGGFDKDIGGWTGDGMTDRDPTWQKADATGCGGSGALRTSNYAYSPCFQVPVSTAFSFGATVNMPSPIIGQGQAECSLQWFSDVSCSQDAPGGAGTLSWQTAGWQTNSIGVATPADAQSARISCRCFNAPTLFDEIFLSPPPTKF